MPSPHCEGTKTDGSCCPKGLAQILERCVNLYHIYTSRLSQRSQSYCMWGYAGCWSRSRFGVFTWARPSYWPSFSHACSPLTMYVQSVRSSFFWNQAVLFGMQPSFCKNVKTPQGTSQGLKPYIFPFLEEPSKRNVATHGQVTRKIPSSLFTYCSLSPENDRVMWLWTCVSAVLSDIRQIWRVGGPQRCR
jgi:hypothetical protein